MSELSQKLEALLFTALSPLTEYDLKEYFRVSLNEIRNAVNELKTILESEQHGIFLSKIADGWVLQTKPELYDSIAAFQESRGVKKITLSKAAIETVAIVAYNQPVTRSEIDNIRGVHSDTIVARLLEHGLIRTAGRKETTGQPLMFKTTKKFLEVFGLNSIEDLPAIEINEQPVSNSPDEINNSDSREIEIKYET